MLVKCYIKYNYIPVFYKKYINFNERQIYINNAIPFNITLLKTNNNLLQSKLLISRKNKNSKIIIRFLTIDSYNNFINVVAHNNIDLFNNNNNLLNECIICLEYINNYDDIVICNM